MQLRSSRATFSRMVRANPHGPVNRISGSQIKIDRCAPGCHSVARYNMIARAYVDRHVLTGSREWKRERKRNATSAGKRGEENETREHTAASSSSVRPGLPSALQLNPTPLRPFGALRLHSFSSGISLNGSRNLDRTLGPTATLLPLPPFPVLFSIRLFHLELKRRDSSLSFSRSLSLSCFLPFSRSILLSSRLLLDPCAELETP